MSKRDVRVEMVPGNWNREERTFLVLLDDMRTSARRVSNRKREDGISSWTYDKERELALEWVLVEVSKSRSALAAARKAE